MRKHSRYRAKFAESSFWNQPDKHKQGFIPVEFQGEVRLARPIFGFSSFIVPSKEFAVANRNSLAVIVEFLDENEGILAWSGMSYWRDAVPEDVQEGYPLKKLHYLDEDWKISSSGVKDSNMFTLENLNDGTFIKLDRTKDESKIQIFDGVTESKIELSEEGNLFRDEVNQVTVQSSEEGFLIENEKEKSSVKINSEGMTLIDGKNKTSIISSSISLGSEEESKEPVLLGDTLVGLLQDAIKVFNNHFHPSGTGPTGTPVTNFTAQMKKISSKLKNSKSKNNTTD